MILVFKPLTSICKICFAVSRIHKYWRLETSTAGKLSLFSAVYRHLSAVFARSNPREGPRCVTKVERRERKSFSFEIGRACRYNKRVVPREVDTP